MLIACRILFTSSIFRAVDFREYSRLGMGAGASSAVSNFIEVTYKTGFDEQLKSQTISEEEFQQIARAYATLKNSGHAIPTGHEPHFLHERSFGNFRVFFSAYQKSVEYLEHECLKKKMRADEGIRVLRSFVEAGLAFQNYYCNRDSSSLSEKVENQLIVEDQDSKVNCLHACAKFYARLHKEGVDSSKMQGDPRYTLREVARTNRSLTLENAIFEVMFSSVFIVPEDKKSLAAVETTCDSNDTANHHRHFVWSPTVWWVERQCSSLWTHAAPFPDQDCILDRICSNIYRLRRRRWLIWNKLIECLSSETEMALSQDRKLQDQVKSLALEYDQSNVDLELYIWWRTIFVLFSKPMSLLIGADMIVNIHEFIVPEVVDEGDKDNAARRVYEQKLRQQKKRAEKNIKESVRLAKKRAGVHRQTISLFIHTKAKKTAEEEQCQAEMEKIRKATRARLNKPLPGNTSYMLPTDTSSEKEGPWKLRDTSSSSNMKEIKLDPDLKMEKKTGKTSKSKVPRETPPADSKVPKQILSPDEATKSKPCQTKEKETVTRPAVEIISTPGIHLETNKTEESEIQEELTKMKKEAGRIKQLGLQARANGEIKQMKKYLTLYKSIKDKMHSMGTNEK